MRKILYLLIFSFLFTGKMVCAENLCGLKLENRAEALTEYGNVLIAKGQTIEKQIPCNKIKTFMSEYPASNIEIKPVDDPEAAAGFTAQKIKENKTYRVVITKCKLLNKNGECTDQEIIRLMR